MSVIPNKQYLISKSWSRGYGVSLLQNNDKIIAQIAAVVEFILKLLSAICASLVVFLTPYAIGASAQNNSGFIYANLILNIIVCICSASLSVIESQFSMPLSSQNNEAKVILASKISNVQQQTRPGNSMIYIIMKIFIMLASFVATSLNSIIINDPSITNIVDYISASSGLAGLSMLLAYIITLGSSAAGTIYLKIRKRIKEIEKQK